MLTTLALAGASAPTSIATSVGSIQNFGSYFGGAFSPLAAGSIHDATGFWAAVFISGSILTAGTRPSAIP